MEEDIGGQVLRVYEVVGDRIDTWDGGSIGRGIKLEYWGQVRDSEEAHIIGCLEVFCDITGQPRSEFSGTSELNNIYRVASGEEEGSWVVTTVGSIADLKIM